jgi:signal transduction histidine kinase
MKTLHSMKPSGLRLVGIANIQRSSSCCKFAEEMGLEIFENCEDLLAMEYLDLVLELTGDENVLADIIMHKPAGVGVLDREASLRLMDMAQIYSQVDRDEAETPLASTLLEASPDGVLVINRKHRIVNCNSSVLIPGSENKSGVIGKHCFEVMYGSNGPCQGLGTCCPAEETLTTGKLARTVYEIPGPDNTTQMRQVTAFPIFDRFGVITQFVLVIRDMTQELSEKIEARTQALKKDLARLVQEDRLTSLGRLVASVCHEINNPITSIVTFTKLVQKILRTLVEQWDLSSSEEISNVERYLDLSFREAMRCGNIVKNLLTFARPKSVEAKVIELSELVSVIMILTSHQLELSNVRCVFDVPAPPFTAWGDYAQIQQCLLNLIFNAIDAMPGGGQITISGGKDPQSDQVWLSVADTGYGIDQDDLQRIFEPFYSTKSEGKGNGLGLSMVYGIIREHNGAVEVESEPGKGTIFRIKLPSCPAVAAEKQAGHGKDQAGLEPGRAASDPIDQNEGASK